MKMKGNRCMMERIILASTIMGIVAVLCAISIGVLTILGVGQ